MPKKQIVFIEPQATVNSYRIARSLKLTKRYETILFCFAKVDKDFYNKAYDRIFVLELDHKFRLNNLIALFKKLLSKEKKYFFREMGKIEPYLFQISGPDLFTLISLFHLKENIPKIYYSNDTWGIAKRWLLFKKFGFKGEFQRICEKICFRKVDGVLNKSSIKQFELLSYKVNVPKIALPPSPFDEFIFYSKNKNREINLVHGGNPNPTIKKRINFLEIIKGVTSQKIYFHTYGPCVVEKDDMIYRREAKKNKYYCIHEKVSPYKLNEEMSKYSFGSLLDFWDETEFKKNPAMVNTDMGSKMINYLEAGLPMIVSDQMEYITEIVKKYGLGLVINIKDLKNLREIIEKQDYVQLKKNIKKFQEEFKMSRVIKEIENFYERVATNSIKKFKRNIQNI
ncbi:Uncharacterised protein [uncultured archaeon]|nr:Uncharacterised protein [uncultured archaeon]